MSDYLGICVYLLPGRLLEARQGLRFEQAAEVCEGNMDWAEVALDIGGQAPFTDRQL